MLTHVQCQPPVWRIFGVRGFYTHAENEGPMNQSPDIAESVPPHRSFRAAWRETFTSGRHFWERGRLAYNATLALLSVGYFLTRLPESRGLLTTDTGITCVVFAVGANIFYSAAYLPEFIIQATMPKRFARPLRLVVLLVGTIFACFVAGFALDCLGFGATD